MALNEVILQGRLVSEPELRHTPNNVAVANMRIAVDRDFKNGSGEREADFINVVTWRQTAEHLVRWFNKGSAVIVKGRLQSKSFTDKEGNRRYDMEVVADNVYFGEPKKKDEGSGWTGQQRQAAQFQELHDDDRNLPF